MVGRRVRRYVAGLAVRGKAAVADAAAWPCGRGQSHRGAGGGGIYSNTIRVDSNLEAHIVTSIVVCIGMY